MNPLAAQSVSSATSSATSPPATALGLPLPWRSLAGYAAALRDGSMTASDATATLLGRIAALNDRLEAYTHVAPMAPRTARALDDLLKSGSDLGPLMGVPIAVKDLYAVDGMPLTAGSRLPIADLAPSEGTLVKRLKRAGAVILGKTRTTEFAFGTFNPTHPTPWNPHDAHARRMPGGSSSGSAVAQAAGLAAITFGTDTGGSVRLPAALCGLAGFKATAGALPMDGVFPLSTTLDSPGWFANSAADLSTVWQTLAGVAMPMPRALAGLRIGKPDKFFFDALDAPVARATEQAIRQLAAAGCTIVPIEVPPLGELDSVFGAYLAAELVGFLSRERVERSLEALDPVARTRILPGLALSATDFVRIRDRLGALARAAHAASAAVDVIVTPTSPRVAMPVSECATLDQATAWTRDALRFTRPANIFGMCGVSLPIGHLGGALPVGLQLLAHGGNDTALLGIAMVVEDALGRPPAADLAAFA